MTNTVALENMDELIEAISGSGPASIDDLTDVDISTPTDGQILTYDDTTDKWVNADPPEGVDELADLDDVDISTPTDGQILTYDDTTDKWVNSDPSSGYTATTLFTGGTSTDTTFTLSDDITNYDDIVIYFHNNDGTDDYDTQCSYRSAFLHARTSSYILGAANDLWYYYFTVTDDTHFAFGKSNNWYITDIIGIKY